MFSNKKASPLALFVPVVLLIVIVVLLVLILKPEKSVSDSNKTATNETENSTNSTDQQPTNTATNQGGQNTQTQNAPVNNEDKFNEAVSAVPAGNYPSNKCAEAIVEESNGNLFALEGSSKYSLSQTDKVWIEANCPDVQKLQF